MLGLTHISIFNTPPTCEAVELDLESVNSSLAIIHLYIDNETILEEFPFDWGLKDSTLSLRQEHWKHWCRFLEHNAKPMESATPELFLQYAQEFSDMAALKDYLCTIRDRCQQKKIFGLDAHSQKMLEDVQRRARFLVDARCRKKAQHL